VALFELPWFIKYIPVSDRARYIYDRCYAPGAKYVATDYSSFEAHFTPKVALSLEWQLYSYLLGGTAAGRAELPWIRRALSGTNRCQFRGSSVKVEGVRMSGDMWTSIGNGFSNLMLMLYCCSRKGCDAVGVVEGDDGLFRVAGNSPTVSDFAELGWTIKLQEGKHIGEMGFCKQYFHEDVRENVVDPRELLVKFGWSMSRLRLGGPEVRKALLRAKADSLVAQYPNAPVARALAEYVFRVVGFTGDRAYEDGWSPGYHDCIRPRWTTPYRSDIRNYMVVERVFGVSVGVQYAIERYLDAKPDLGPLDCDAISVLMLPQWRVFDERYTATYPSDLSYAMSVS